MDSLLHSIISNYRDNPCLWDTYSIDYRKKNKRTASMDAIAKELHLSGLLF